MKVILIRDVAKVGRRREVREVADGYAKNFLIARGLALPATKENIKKLNHELGVNLAELAKQEEKLKSFLVKLSQQKVKISAKADPATGHLFAGIHEAEITQALAKQTDGEIKLEASLIILPEVIRKVGEYQINVKSGQVAGEFTLVVEAETKKH
ncbi:MAG: 50S ribosomal protein L9 [Patescibacteria group bacterium]